MSEENNTEATDAPEEVVAPVDATVEAPKEETARKEERHLR